MIHHQIEGFIHVYLPKLICLFLPGGDGSIMKDDQRWSSRGRHTAVRLCNLKKNMDVPLLRDAALLAEKHMDLDTTRQRTLSAEHARFGFGKWAIKGCAVSLSRKHSQTLYLLIDRSGFMHSLHGQREQKCSFDLRRLQHNYLHGFQVTVTCCPFLLGEPPSAFLKLHSLSEGRPRIMLALLLWARECWLTVDAGLPLLQLDAKTATSYCNRW